MQWGGQDDWLSTLPPDAPARAMEPELWEENLDAYQAFGELSQSRQMGMMGAGFIALSEVAAYCALYGVDDPADLARKIRAMDAVWVAHMNSEAKRDRDQRKLER